MSDTIARRRELRKRKILENAELRKQKIFGVNSSSNNCMPKLESPLNEDIFLNKIIDDQDGTASVKSNDSEMSSRSQDNESSLDSQPDIMKLNDILRNIPDPLTEENEKLLETVDEQSLPDSTHLADDESKFASYTSSFNRNLSSPYNSNAHSNNGSSLLNSTNNSFINDGSSFILGFLEHPAAPCVLALIVSLLIFFDLANLVSHSLIIPFCIWEIQLIISLSFLASEEESSSFLETALLFCGIRKSKISKYVWILKLMKDILQDFAVYIITIVIWQVFIGFTPIHVKA